MKSVLLFAVCFILDLGLSEGNLDDLLIPCCNEGLDWSLGDNRCSSHPGYVANITREDLPTCRSVIELCCIKDVFVKQCEKGKENALEGQMCAIRDSEEGAGKYKECCLCCELGLVAKSQGLSCQTPNYGSPCDNMFHECCTGQKYYDVFNSTADDRNECALFPGQICSHTCVNTVGSFRCECRDGYTLNVDGRTCEQSDDTDYGDGEYDCQDNNPCEHRCFALDDENVQCSCYEGFTINNDGRTCTDIDECADGTYQCAPTQECVNTPGRYTCHTAQCETGYVFNPITRTCEESFECERGFGFNSVTRQCEDLNECGLGIDTCLVGERCDNTIGSYSCRRFRHCGTGYTLDTQSQRCKDDDECVLGTHNCGRGYQCVNVQGSFRCEVRRCEEGTRFNPANGECERVNCNRGLRPDRIGNCIDINECTEYSTICNQYQQCVNTIGSYQCRSLVNCPNGFETNENGRCVDIDECASGKHRCAGEQQCVNRQGSYFCQCPRGYRFINNICEDVDECAYSAAICPLQSKCQNTPGSYVCTCKDGLESDGRGGCLDIDECTTRNICHHKCINNFGSYFCTCNRGYQLSVDQRTCEDIDECNQFAGRGRVCGGRCINTPGSFTCDCPDGWKKSRDARSCEDIDECSDGTAFCPSRDSTCVNIRGGYKCPVVQCPEGFVKTVPGGQQNAELIADEGGVVCGRISCNPLDEVCERNKTKTISWQFLALPSIDFVKIPVTLLNIKTIGYSIYPNLDLRIIAGNRDRFFDTVVEGDKAALRLLRPLPGPRERQITLQLENRDFSRRRVISRHITHVTMFISEYNANHVF